jgi:predicted lactoylglutathione lyase
MDQRISIITLGVADLGRSRSFYERLGWRKSSASNDAITFFQAGGMIVALCSRPELAKDATIDDAAPAADSRGFAGFTLSYNAPSRAEVDAVIAEAKAAGAKILKPAQQASWGGYSGYFADPDNFAWEVAFNPSFPIDEDGAIQLPD